MAGQAKRPLSEAQRATLEKGRAIARERRSAGLPHKRTERAIEERATGKRRIADGAYGASGAPAAPEKPERSSGKAGAAAPAKPVKRNGSSGRRQAEPPKRGRDWLGIAADIIGAR